MAAMVGAAPVTADDGETVEADISYSPAQPAPFEDIRFDASNSVGANGFSPYSWEYETATGTRTTSGETFTHSFDEPGVYEVTLTVDSGIEIDQETVFVSVASEGPVADFEFRPDQPDLEETVRFDASPTSAPSVNVVEYRWYIDGEFEGTGQDFSHSFSESDIYTVEMEAENRAGETDRVSKIVAAGSLDDANPDFTLQRSEPLDQRVSVNPGNSVLFVGELDADRLPDGQAAYYVDGTLESQSEVRSTSFELDREFEELGERTVSLELDGRAGRSESVRWDVVVHNFNALPEVSEQASSTTLEVGGDTEILTFSVENPESNDDDIEAEILTQLPDGMSVSGARDVVTGDAATLTGRETVSPGETSSIELDINVDDDRLKGTEIVIPYLVRYYSEENPDIVYTDREGDIELVIPADSDTADQPPESDGQDDSVTDDESPGFGVIPAVLAFVLMVGKYVFDEELV